MKNKQGILNVSISIIFKLFLLIMNLIVRRYVIQYLGNEINGINSLYTSIIGFLSIAELGVGTAITFCMYRPIVENNIAQVAALYRLFVKAYTIIGIFIFVMGSAIIPFLPKMAKGYENLSINLTLTYLLMLISVVLTYFFSSKISLINAYKNNYIATTIMSSGILIQGLIQIIIIKITHSFVAYLICHIIIVLYQWLLTEIYVKKKYRDIISSNNFVLDNNIKKEVIKNIKALFLHKIGAILVNTVDSTVISFFIGITILGKYTNYVVLITAITGLMALFFTPLTSIIGQLYVKKKEEAFEYFKFFHSFNFIIGLLFLLGYYSIIDNMINIIFGKNLLLNREIKIVITINYFIQFMRNATMLFKDATGTFYYDRWKPVAEGISNLFLSLVFINVFPKEYAVVGVIIATILTNLFICHLIEPFVLLKYGFRKTVVKYWIKNYLFIIWFVLSILIFDKIKISANNQIKEIVVNGALATMIAIFGIIFIFIFDKHFNKYVNKIIKSILKK